MSGAPSGGSVAPASSPVVVPAAPQTPSAPTHDTYGALVNDDTDLVGHVAYALYKRDKLKFCATEFSRTGARPSTETIDSFIRSSNIDSRVSAYRAEAELLLKQMTSFVLADAIDENRREYAEQMTQKLGEGKSLLRVCGEAVVGSVAVAGAWALIVALLYGASIGPGRMLHDIFNIDASRSGVAAAPTPSASPASR